MLAAIPVFLAPILAVLFAAAIFVTVYSIVSRRDAARKKAMEAVSKTVGASFSEKDPYGLALQLRQFSLFRREGKGLFRNNSISNVFRSTVGETEVYMFDYFYVISTGKSSHRVYQTVFFANDKNWYLPRFHLKPENWWHKILKGLGMEQDINFEENREFSEKFWLKSAFEDIVRQQFTPELQQFMLERPPVNLEGDNYYLLAYKPGKRVPPAEAKQFFENCCALTRLLQTEGKTELLRLVDTPKETALEEIPPTPLEKNK